MFAWYWLADACNEEGIPFVLGHALEMRAIHGTKTKNDKVDSEKIAHLLRTGLLPQAYVYPAEMRATRDLLRRRGHLVRRRAEALTHVQIIHGQYNVAAATGKLRYPANRAGVLDRFEDEAVRRTLGVDLALAEHLDGQIAELEAYLAAQAKVHDLPNFYRLRSIPGVGKVLALTILYEVGDIRRFDDAGQFLSYARLVRPAKESAGKRVGTLEPQDGQRPPEVGVPRGRGADDPARAGGQGVRGPEGQGARQGQGAGDPGREARPRRLRDAATRRPLR